MPKQFSGFEPAHQAFVADQPIYFVATAAPDGHVNVSPKGRDSLRILGPNRLVWRNLTGSGNETAAHTAPGQPHDHHASVTHEGKPGWGDHHSKKAE